MYRLFAQCPWEGFTVSMVLGNRNAIRVGLLGSSRAGFHRSKVETESCEPIMNYDDADEEIRFIAAFRQLTMMVPVYNTGAQWLSGNCKA